MRVLVTGGTGYIGAHAVHLLADRGDDVVIVDDVRTGSEHRVPNFPLIRLDLGDSGSVPALVELLRRYEIEAVVHFAARKQVGESVRQPAWYYTENVGGLGHLLLAMEEAAVRRLIFSSSAAVYGAAQGAVDETIDPRPISPYGETKLAGERLIEDCVRAWGLSAVSLRYFNVGGAGRPGLADTEALNLIPLIFDRVEAGLPPLVFGGDYDTPDGSCVRDYVHVVDVVEAHLAVLDALPTGAGHQVFNIGTGAGTSVLEVIAEVSRVIGTPLHADVVDRRPGDADSIVAVVERISAAVGWRSRYGLAEIVESAWLARLPAVDPRSRGSKIRGFGQDPV